MSTVEETHVHEVNCTQGDFEWCECGTFFRKKNCPPGTWHHISEMSGTNGKSLCPCERTAKLAATEEREQAAGNGNPKATGGKKRRPERPPYRRHSRPGVSWR
jgi:hypothetical protein